MKVVVCGSYGDLEEFQKVLGKFQNEYGPANVFPNSGHMEKAMPCAIAHHVIGRETNETILARSELMRTYFDRIDSADLVVFVNEKNGKEHYGVGTTMEIGYAFSKGKRLFFTREPTNSNILSLLKISRT